MGDILENKQNEVNNENEHTYQTVKAKKVVLKDNYNFFPKNFFKRFFSRLFCKFCSFFAFPFCFVFMGVRVKGRKNYHKTKKQGTIIISNHIHPMDSFLIAFSSFNHRTYVTSLQSNLGLPFGMGWFIRSIGAVPIPEEPKQMIRFTRQFVDTLNKKRKIVIFPEAALHPFCDHIRPFKQGAFRFAILGDAVILPVVWTFHKPKGLYKLFRKKPCLTLNYLEPYHINREGSRAQIAERANNDLFEIMSKFFNEHTNYKYIKKEKKKPL